MDLRDFAKKSDENSENHKKRLDKKVLFILDIINDTLFYYLSVYKKYGDNVIMAWNLCRFSQTINF